MDKKDRLYKLFQGSETAIWAHDEIVRQDKHIAELESHNLGLTKTLVEIEQEREIRDLEQRINALQAHASSCAVMGIEPSTRTLNARIEMLRKQAKQLKDDTQ